MLRAPAPGPQVQVRRGVDRPATRHEGVVSRHCFSFGTHYDSANTSFGVLLASNHDVLQPGAGYATHPHRDLEIVTWVLSGTLLHRDSTGRAAELRAGQVQRMSAGSGLRHSEHAGEAGPVDLVQMWVVPDRTGGPPGWELGEAPDLAGRLVPVVSGRPEHAGALRVGQHQAALHAGRLASGETAPLPAAPYVHVYVARGRLDLEGAGRLEAGDSARLTGTGALNATAAEDAELLVWEMQAR